MGVAATAFIKRSFKSSLLSYKLKHDQNFNQKSSLGFHHKPKEVNQSKIKKKQKKKKNLNDQEKVQLSDSSPFAFDRLKNAI